MFQVLRLFDIRLAVFLLFTLGLLTSTLVQSSAHGAFGVALEDEISTTQNEDGQWMRSVRFVDGSLMWLCINASGDGSGHGRDCPGCAGFVLSIAPAMPQPTWLAEKRSTAFRPVARASRPNDLTFLTSLGQRAPPHLTA
ncbi:MAG: hypothetical protein AAF234_13875 [Pseudomonadota bacterium]